MNYRQLTYHFLTFTLLVASVFSFSLNVSGQTYNFSSFNVPEGLPQSSVNAIYNDSRGYLWVATSGGGVAQFDGKTFIQHNEKDGLAGNIVTGIAEDKEGNMWFTSTWGGISKYNGRNMVVLTQNDRLQNNSNKCIFIDKNNRIWIGSSSGLCYYENGFFHTLNKSLFNNEINFITSDNKNNIWVGTSNGLIKINGKDTLYFNTENNLPSNNITSLVQDNEGNYLVGFKDAGIHKILAGSIDKEAKLEIETINATQKVSSILEDNDKNIWYATFNNGIYHINTSSNEIKHISKENGLETNNINNLYKDRIGNIWIGTNGSGIIRVNNTAFTYFNEIEGLNQNDIFGIINDNNENLWVATASTGVYKYDGKTSTQYTELNGLGSNTVRAIAKDNDGNLWFATKNGLSKYSNGVFRNYTTKDGLPSNEIKSLLFDKRGYLWIGTNGGGLCKYDFNTFTTYTPDDGLSHNYIHSLFLDKKNNLWIGTGNGINRMSKEEITSFPISKICNAYISSITEDDYGNLWFGTDRCLTKYDGIDFTSYTTKNGLSSDVIYLVHYHKRGQLWVGTNNGLDKFTFNSYGQVDEIKNYGFSDGFRGIECNSRAIYEDVKSNLWIGTVKGLIEYTPSKDRENVFESKTHITSVKLFFENVNWLGYTKELTKWYNLPENIKLNYNQNHITFEFNSINLSHPEAVLYSFKLEGFDSDWFTATTKDFATYSNLPPGNYTFKVKSRNNDGVWNQQAVTFSFTIKAPFWQKWWFYLIVGLGTFYLVFRLATYKEKRQLQISKELEEKVKERTMLIEKQRDEKEILLKEIHHRVKNNMQVINSLLSIQSNYTKDEKALALFSEAQNRIRSMALIHEKMYQSEDLSKIDVQDYIVSLIDDLVSSYSVNCNINLDLKIDQLKFEIDTLIPIGLLLNEIISNSLKYAFKNEDKGTITIYLSEQNDNTFKLIIGDNGVGMPKGMLQKDDETLGMELIKVFVSQIDGEIKRMDKDGTYFEIDFKKRIIKK
ncbi:MAG: two-component regulator propeller domain-containing protein [Vicingaceae bacterium]|nr:two-component regulator propeller domain-containing protein [Vicingaceae bacterium]